TFGLFLTLSCSMSGVSHASIMRSSSSSPPCRCMLLKSVVASSITIREFGCSFSVLTTLAPLPRFLITMYGDWWIDVEDGSRYVGRRCARFIVVPLRDDPVGPTSKVY